MEAAPPALMVGRCGVAGGRLTTRARFMSPVWGVRLSGSSVGKRELRGVIRGSFGLGSLKRRGSGFGGLELGILGRGDLAVIRAAGGGGGGGSSGGEEGGSSVGSSGYSVGKSPGREDDGVLIPGGGVLLRPIGGTGGGWLWGCGVVECG